MADYRQDCSTPGCAYTGFAGHSPHCPVPSRIWAAEKERAAKKNKEDYAWSKFFSEMSDEELFEYKAKCEDEVSKVHKWRQRLDRVNYYMLYAYKNHEYRKWKSDRRKIQE